MNIEFDENDIVDINATIRKLIDIKKNLVGSDKSNAIVDRWSKKTDKNVKIFNSIERLYGSNSPELRVLYLADEGPCDFYVYAHCDPRTKLNINSSPKDLFAAKLGLLYKPVYIGKGQGNRAYDLNRNDSHRKIRTELIRCGMDYEVVKIKTDLTLGDALLFEAKLIDIFGMSYFAKTSWLVNLDEGKYSGERRKLYSKGSGKILMYNKYA